MTVFVIILCSFSSFISGIWFFLGFDAWMESKEEFEPIYAQRVLHVSKDPF